MKYWVFQNNQVNGPYEPEDLPQLPGYSGETLVCTEGRKGTNMGDWQRASMVPELSVSLLKASQLALTIKDSSGYGGLPPEPTLKDLAALGSLQEKVSLLDNTVGHLQESLRLKEDELLSLHKELEDKNRGAQELAVKLGGLEEKLSTVNTLQDGLDKAVAAEHDVETTVSKQSQLISELTQQLESVKKEQQQIEQLKSELAQVKQEQGRAQREASSASALRGAPQPQGGGFSPPPVSIFASAPPVSGAPAPAFGAEPFRAQPLTTPMSGLEPAAMPINFDSPSPMTAPLGAPLPLGPAPASFGVEPPSVGSAAPAPDLAVAASKKSGAGRFLFSILALALMGAGAAFKMGLLPIPKKGFPGQDRAPLSPPAMPAEPDNSAKALSPEEELESQKKSAIELVRGWQLPAGQTVAEKLEGSAAPGGLSPWMADRAKDGSFQVNFYAPKKAKAASKTYEFAVSLAEGKVSAHNESAAALLKAPETSGEAPKKGRSGRARAKAPSNDKPMLEDLLNVSEETPAPEPPLEASVDAALAEATPASAKGRPKVKPKRRKAEPVRDANKDLEDVLAGSEEKPKIKTAVPQESLDQLLLPGNAKEAQEPIAEPSPEDSAPAPKARSKKKAKAQPADAELLDDLLKP